MGAAVERGRSERVNTRQRVNKHVEQYLLFSADLLIHCSLLCQGWLCVRKCLQQGHQ